LQARECLAGALKQQEGAAAAAAGGNAEPGPGAPRAQDASGSIDELIEKTKARLDDIKQRLR
jgi:hypothetical protein